MRDKKFFRDTIEDDENQTIKGEKNQLQNTQTSPVNAIKNPVLATILGLLVGLIGGGLVESSYFPSFKDVFAVLFQIVAVFLGSLFILLVVTLILLFADSMLMAFYLSFLIRIYKRNDSGMPAVMSEKDLLANIIVFSILITTLNNVFIFTEPLIINILSFMPVILISLLSYAIYTHSYSNKVKVLGQTTIDWPKY